MWPFAPDLLQQPAQPFGKPGVIPGFRLALGFAVTYLSLVVLLPLAGLVLKAASLGWADFVAIATSGRTLAALRISFGLALAAACINAVLRSVSFPMATV